MSGLHNEIPLRVKMTITVDACIAKELKTLIEKHRVETLYSCCGHAGQAHSQRPQGYIIVGTQESAAKMLSLGYEKIDSDRMWCIKVGKRIRTTACYITSTFRPKSICKCGRKKHERKRKRN